MSHRKPVSGWIIAAITIVPWIVAGVLFFLAITTTTWYWIDLWGATLFIQGAAMFWIGRRSQAVQEKHEVQP